MRRGAFRCSNRSRTHSKPEAIGGLPPVSALGDDVCGRPANGQSRPTQASRARLRTAGMGAHLAPDSCPVLQFVQGTGDVIMKPYWNINSFRRSDSDSHPALVTLIQHLPLHLCRDSSPPRAMDRYPCVNRYKHGADCPGWVNVHGARCEDCVVYNR
ncbi:hypothetical protein LX36DRAFT_750399 [Colletotrichum falcatum]|nr:hypothetical protein LX36DRAFT_750399 [Colletotrichum falcatum]